MRENKTIAIKCSSGILTDTRSVNLSISLNHGITLRNTALLTFLRCFPTGNSLRPGRNSLITSNLSLTSFLVHLVRQRLPMSCCIFILKAVQRRHPFVPIHFGSSISPSSPYPTKAYFLISNDREDILGDSFRCKARALLTLAFRVYRFGQEHGNMTGLRWAEENL